MAFLEYNNANIYYEVHGDNSDEPVITLVNGHTRTTSDFRMMIKELRKNGLRVITLDPRGSGKTEFAGEISLEQICEDIIGIWDHLNIKSSFLLGISMGGGICQLVTIKAPERVSKLILVSTAPSAEWIVPDPHEWSTDYDIIYKKFSRFFSESFIKSNKLLLEAMAKQIQKVAGNSDFVEKSQNQRRAIDKLSLKDKVKNIHCPTLIIYGDADSAVLPEGSIFLSEHIRNSKVIAFPKVGHLILAEVPKLFYSSVIDFCLDH